MERPHPTWMYRHIFLAEVHSWFGGIFFSVYLLESSPILILTMIASKIRYSSPSPLYLKNSLFIHFLYIFFDTEQAVNGLFRSKWINYKCSLICQRDHEPTEFSPQCRKFKLTHLLLIHRQSQGRSTLYHTPLLDHLHGSTVDKIRAPSVLLRTMWLSYRRMRIYWLHQHHLIGKGNIGYRWKMQQRSSHLVVVL